MRTLSIFLFIFLAVHSFQTTAQQQISPVKLRQLFKDPPPAASPWVFWYWLHGEVSKPGITADLEAMKEAGIGGAYLMTIKDTTHPSIMQPPARQLTPEWWNMVGFAMTEAKRLGLQLGMHVSDGFALAGGPWITPELSMQKVVWSRVQVKGNNFVEQQLPQPETNEGYYKDIAVFAFPVPAGQLLNTQIVKPLVTSSGGDSAAALLTDAANTKNFVCNEGCFVQYQFKEPFTCRSVTIKSKTNYEANRFIVQMSDDGVHFTEVSRLQPTRHGWQDWDSYYTHGIPATTAKYFRFVFDKEGTEPGAEDLDAAKWKPVLKVFGIELSNQPVIHQFEAKNGEVWRVAKRSDDGLLPDTACVPLKAIINISRFVDSKGRLQWQAPAGNWTILRMGHTSTGHKNETAGGGKGLECDKFDPAAITLQFNNWFGQVFKKLDSGTVSRVLKVFHVDSWECGSQNWSRVFAAEFQKRRGYDLVNYLPAIAGVPIESNEVSERFLYDVRKTIAELISDQFYGTLATLAHQKGCTFTAESVAPTMVSDGLLHYKNTDIPMGEFWLRSPTHDKPNDLLDAISGAHIYGKPIVQAEAFTQLRMAWNEHPALLKPVQDRNYALGINKLVYHVFMHNPLPAQKPGTTLDGIGLFFQRNQTWWRQGKAWVDYARRCQALLQVGNAVADIAVFTGDEYPSRSVLPDRLVHVLPGIFGSSRVKDEAIRLANISQPLRVMPAGVTHSANMADPENWINPLRGYAYDSYNADALLRLSSVKNGRIVLPGGASYGLLVLPGIHKMNPNGDRMSADVAKKIQQMVKAGANIIISDLPVKTTGLGQMPGHEAQLEAVKRDLLSNEKNEPLQMYSVKRAGEGKVWYGPFIDSNFAVFNLQPDILINNHDGSHAADIAYTHRVAPGVDIYFLSNQLSEPQTIHVSLRVAGKVPELWDPVTGSVADAATYTFSKGRTGLSVKLQPFASLFIVLKKPAVKAMVKARNNWPAYSKVQEMSGPWTVQFDTAFGGPEKPALLNGLISWSRHTDPAIKYYSGTAIYQNNFRLNKRDAKNIWLDLGEVANMARVSVNGIDCGIAWTAPYKVDISGAVKAGKNELRIEVVNTWANRLMGDKLLPPEQRITHTNAPYRLADNLLAAGLLGPVVIERQAAP